MIASPTRPIGRLSVAMCVAACFASCVSTSAEDLFSLATKPALPYSVLVSGGGFVDASATVNSESPFARTFALPGESVEAFSLERLVSRMRDGRVFVSMALDAGPVAARETIASTTEEVAPGVAALRTTLSRARRQGHDFPLVVEKIIDGPIEYRGVNDRWPFTFVAWLFALGSVIPDHTYESHAQLRVSMRDVYSGRRVFSGLVVSGPVNLNMFERCGILGFLQSLIIPPFWTLTDAENIIDSVREASIERILVSAVRRLKSAEARTALDESGPASIQIEREKRVWRVKVTAKEPISAVAVRLDGNLIDSTVAEAFERSLLDSRSGGPNEYQYSALWSVPGGRRLQILIETDAARVSSVTQSLKDN